MTCSCCTAAPAGCDVSDNDSGLGQSVKETHEFGTDCRRMDWGWGVKGGAS